MRAAPIFRSSRSPLAVGVRSRKISRTELTNYIISKQTNSKIIITSTIHFFFKSSHGSTYGFILNMSLTPMPSLCLFLSVTSLSLVQVMCTRSGVAPAALSFIVEWDAVFLSWISWAWTEDGQIKKKVVVVFITSSFFSDFYWWNIGFPLKSSGSSGETLI